MTIGEIITLMFVPALSGCFGAVCANIYASRWRERRDAPQPSPSLQLGMGDAHPYRALQASAPADAVQLALDLSDEAVRRERARVLAIVRAAGEADGTKDGKRVMNAIIAGVGSAP